MKRNFGFWSFATLRMIILDFGLAVGLILLVAGAAAQGGYDLSWWTIDGGGYTFSSGEGYSLGGTIGQADAGVLAGSGYQLSGGFWNGGGLYKVYLPMVVKGY